MLNCIYLFLVIYQKELLLLNSYFFFFFWSKIFLERIGLVLESRSIFYIFIKDLFRHCFNFLLIRIIYTCFTIQFSSLAQSCPTLCDPMNHSTPGLPVHHPLPEVTQTHGHWVGDAIQPSHPLSSPFPPAPNPSQHQGLFQWVNSSHEVAKVLEFQL